MSRGLTILGYAVLAVAAGGYQLVALTTRRTATLGEALRPLTRSLLGRATLLAAWLWAGWHLFVRAGWR